MSKEFYPALTLSMAISGEVQAHRFVGTDNAVCGAGENSLGVTDTYGKDEVTAVTVLGAMPVETGAAVTAGGLVESDASGRAIDNSTGTAVARALQSATAAGQFVQCILIPN